MHAINIMTHEAIGSTDKFTQARSGAIFTATGTYFLMLLLQLELLIFLIPGVNHPALPYCSVRDPQIIRRGRY